MIKSAIFGILLLVPWLSFAETVPEPIRDTSYDWRCREADGAVISNHSRLDRALFRCQLEKIENPTIDYVVEAGRYRIEWNPPSEENTAVVEEPLRNASFHLFWEDPIENQNGSPLTDLALIRIHVEGPTTLRKSVAPGVQATIIDDVLPGVYTVWAYALDSEGHESVPSNSITKTAI